MMLSLAITIQRNNSSPSITEMNGDCDEGFGVMNIRYGQCTAGRGVITYGRIAIMEAVEIREWQQDRETARDHHRHWIGVFSSHGNEFNDARRARYHPSRQEKAVYEICRAEVGVSV